MLNDQDEPRDVPEEQVGSPPDSLDETIAQIQALIDECIAILERRIARRG